MNRPPAPRSTRLALLLVLGACAPKPAPVAVATAPNAPPALHVRCFEGLDGRDTHNACTLSSEGVSIALGAIQVLPVCAARGGSLPRVTGGWPTSPEAWTPSCYGAGDSFACSFLLEMPGRPGQPPADVLVTWGGRSTEFERYELPTLGAPFAPFTTRPDDALDTRGAVEVAAWPRVLGGVARVNTSCAAGVALP